jgi:hypothetical protein
MPAGQAGPIKVLGHDEKKEVIFTRIREPVLTLIPEAAGRDWL